MLILIVLILTTCPLFASIELDQNTIVQLDQATYFQSQLSRDNLPKLRLKLERLRFPLSTQHHQEQKKLFQEALSLSLKILNSSEFRSQVLAATYEGANRPTLRANYLWNNRKKRLTNYGIYMTLMRAKERMFPRTAKVMNIYAYMHDCSSDQGRSERWCNRVIGSTMPYKSKVITMNWNFYKNYTKAQMVRNIVHEWMHLLGFLHQSYSQEERYKLFQEAPYIVGQIAMNIAQEYINENINLN